MSDRLEEIKGAGLVLLIMAAFALLVIAWQTYQLLLVMFGGVLLAIFLRRCAEIINKLTKIKVEVAVVVATVLILLVLALGGWLFASTIRTQVADLSQALPKAIEQVKTVSATRIFNYELWTGFTPSSLLTGRTDRVVGFVSSFFSQATSLLTAAVVAAIMALYMALEPKTYIKGSKLVFPKRWRKKIDKIYVRLGKLLWWWMLGRVASMIAVGLLTLIGLSLLGAPYAFVLALMACILTVIPYLGPILSAIPAVLVGLSVNASLAVGILLMFMIVQVIEGNFMTPLVERRTLRLPPALTIGAQLLFGVLAGPVGVVLASPLAVVVVVVVEVVQNQRSSSWAGE